MAKRTRSVWLWRPSLRRRFVRCVSAVRGLMKSFSAMPGLFSPSAASWRIMRSRGESVCNGSEVSAVFAVRVLMAHSESGALRKRRRYWFRRWMPQASLRVGVSPAERAWAHLRQRRRFAKVKWRRTAGEQVGTGIGCAHPPDGVRARGSLCRQEQLSVPAGLSARSRRRLREILMPTKGPRWRLGLATAQSVPVVAHAEADELQWGERCRRRLKFVGIDAINEG
jgi:hypothetical protein